MTAGCAKDGRAVDFRLRAGEGVDGDRVAGVTAAILEGGCPSAPGRPWEPEPLYHDAWTRTTPAAARPRPPRLGSGVYGFAAWGRDADCAIVAAGCAPVSLPLPSGAEIVVVLDAVADGPGCESPGCEAGRCPEEAPSDAGRPDPGRDAGPPPRADAGPAPRCDGAGAVVGLSMTRRGGCVARDDCTVACWPGASGTPEPWEPEARWTAVGRSDGSSRNICAVHRDGGLYCERLDCAGTTLAGVALSDPRVAAGRVIGAAHDVHSCYVDQESALRCVGGVNEVRGRGFDPGRDCEAPPTLAGVVDASANYRHVCAVTAAGALYCWGDGRDGELGGDRLDIVHVPERVGTGRAWARVSVGYAHSMAVAADGSLWAWGRGGAAMGLGDVSTSFTPARVGDRTDWAAVAGGYGASCALTIEGALWCTGDGALFEDGADRSELTRIGTDTGWEHVALGREAACAVRGGELYCWGLNTARQLGFADDAARPVPTRVPLP